MNLQFHPLLASIGDTRGRPAASKIWPQRRRRRAVKSSTSATPASRCPAGDDDQVFAFSLRANFWILPVEVFGIAVKAKPLGTLNRAR